jgi:hypothetical protein
MNIHFIILNSGHAIELEEKCPVTPGIQQPLVC